MWVGENLSCCEHRSCGYAIGLQDMHGLIVVTCTGPCGENLIQRGLVAPTHRQRGKSSVLSQLGLTDRPTEPAPFVLGVDGERHPRIVLLTRIDTMRYHKRMPVADGSGEPTRA